MGDGGVSDFGARPSGSDDQRPLHVARALPAASDLEQDIDVTRGVVAQQLVPVTEGKQRALACEVMRPNNAIRNLMVCGPMARSVEDLRLSLNILAGPDGQDLSVSPVALETA